jgi:hypothetical protein
MPPTPTTRATGLRNGELVTVTYGDVIATATYLAGTDQDRAVVRLSGTDQILTVPRSWIARRTTADSAP